MTTNPLPPLTFHHSMFRRRAPGNAGTADEEQRLLPPSALVHIHGCATDPSWKPWSSEEGGVEWQRGVQYLVPAIVSWLILVLLAVFGVGRTLYPPLEVQRHHGNATLCLAVDRLVTKATARLSIGTPPQELLLLVRMDEIVVREDGSDTANMVRLWTPHILESSSLACYEAALSGSVGVTRCNDSATFLEQITETDGLHVLPRLERVRATLGVDIVSTPPWSRYRFDAELYDGELLMPLQDETSFVTMDLAHLCFGNGTTTTTPPIDQEGATTAVFSYTQRNVTATRHEMWKASIAVADDMEDAVVLHGFLGTTPVASCDRPFEVELFPVAAADEGSWLGISEEQTTRFYNIEGTLDELHDVADKGLLCTSAPSSLSRGSTIFQAQCSLYGICDRSPSVPFRRLADSIIEIRRQGTCSSSACDAVLGARRSVVLEQLHEFAPQEAISRGLLRVVVVLFVALTMYVHADDPNSKGEWLYKHCLKRMALIADSEPIPDFPCQGFNPQWILTMIRTGNWESIEDAFLGGACVALRVLITYQSIDLLTEDGRRWTAEVSLVVSVVAAVYWVVRMFLILTGYGSKFMHDDELPATINRHALNTLKSLLGGTAAIVDANTTMLLAFATPPVSAANERFDAIARLLVGALGAMLTIPRCVWSASCATCQLTQVRRLQGKCLASRAIVWTLACLLSVAQWTLQAVACIVLTADLVTTPSAILWTRSMYGSPTPTAGVLLLGLVTLGTSRALRQADDVIAWKRAGMPDKGCPD